MYEITRGAIVRVGVDLAKRVIQVHAVDAAGRRVVGRALKPEQFVAWRVQLPVIGPLPQIAPKKLFAASLWQGGMRRRGRPI